MSRGVDWDKVRRQNRAAKPQLLLQTEEPKWVGKARVKIMDSGRGRAEWRFYRQEWGCWTADGDLAWMIGHSAGSALSELRRLGITWKWI